MAFTYRNTTKEHSTMGHVVLISGASRGIGRLTAMLLHERGYRVFGTARRPEGTASPFRMLALDVTDDASVRAAVAAVIAEAGRLDVLVNNAGYDLYGAAEDTTIDELQAQVDANFLGAVRLTTAALPQMRRQGCGRIVTMSSVGGLLALPYNSAYAASKFALEGYSESLRYELLPSGIFVSLIEPGQVRTDTLETSIRSAGGAHAETVAERARALGRSASLLPEEVARAVVRVVEARRPRLRYPVGGQARQVVWLKKLLPAPLLEAFIMRQFVTGPAAENGRSLRA
jgi:NAD(P)-dependent dehydrogenase (short-subunit alcohol dehydrogenase family)